MAPSIYCETTTKSDPLALKLYLLLGVDGRGAAEAKLIFRKEFRRF